LPCRSLAIAHHSHRLALRASRAQGGAGQGQHQQPPAAEAAAEAELLGGEDVEEQRALLESLQQLRVRGQQEPPQACRGEQQRREAQGEGGLLENVVTAGVLAYGAYHLVRGVYGALTGARDKGAEDEE
jgi:hypothetical protein